jgi:peptidoglycan/xylan/chitin deacetylase (PgdA/CDA1 family)
MGPNGVRIISRFTRLTDLNRLITRSGKPFIAPFYHVVSDAPLPHIKHLYRFRTVSEFEQDLDNLLTCFDPISLEEYRQGEADARKKPTMLLSFDDGLAECHSLIAPMLRKKGIPAVFFLNNLFIDNQGLFYRYKVSLIIDLILNDPSAMSRAGEFLHVPEARVKELLLSVSYSQQILLDALAPELGIDFNSFGMEQPVYMSSEEIRELIGWGFEIGAHSKDHPQMNRMDQEIVVREVLSSVLDLQKRFMVKVSGFAFPFTSMGIERHVLQSLMDQELTLFGISGIRETGTDRYVQRIDMEAFALPALEVMKMKYLHYLFRKRTGRERIY